MEMPRSLKWGFWIVSGALAMLAASILLLVAYFIFLLAGEPSKDEVARAISSTGKVDAVLLETNGGNVIWVRGLCRGAWRSTFWISGCFPIWRHSQPARLRR
jgi:hypothetical protein